MGTESIGHVRSALHLRALEERFRCTLRHEAFENWRQGFMQEHHEQVLAMAKGPVGAPWGVAWRSHLAHVPLRVTPWDPPSVEAPHRTTHTPETPLHALCLFNFDDLITWKTEEVREILSQKPRASNLRISYCSTEQDLWESAEAGFSAVTLAMGELDVCKTQYLAEMAKEVGLALVPCIETLNDLHLTLETDIPWCVFAPPGNAEQQVVTLSRWLPLVPGNLGTLAWCSPLSQNQRNSLMRLGLKGFLEC